MTQKEIKKALVDARIADTIKDNEGEFVGRIINAVADLYVAGAVTYNFYEKVMDYIYDGRLEEDAYEARPDLFVRLYAKGTIRKAVN